MKLHRLEMLFPFGGFLLDSITLDPDHVRVTLRRHRRKRVPCHMCGASMTIYRETIQSVRDLPLGTAKDVRIIYPALLARYPVCRGIETILPPGIQPHAKATDRLMRQVSLLARFLPISQVSQVTGIPPATARRWDCLLYTSRRG